MAAAAAFLSAKLLWAPAAAAAKEGRKERGIVITASLFLSRCVCASWNLHAHAVKSVHLVCASDKIATALYSSGVPTFFYPKKSVSEPPTYGKKVHAIFRASSLNGLAEGSRERKRLLIEKSMEQQQVLAQEEL